MLALLPFWCQNKSGNMGAEDGGVLAPNLSENYLAGLWEISSILEKKVYFCPNVSFGL